MKKNIRVNNIPFENVIISEEGENIIYARGCKEEFFGVYNIDVGGKNILCESNSPKKVYCEIILDGKVYNNIPFRVVKNNNPKIIINKNTINENMLDEKTMMLEMSRLRGEIKELSKNKELLNESAKKDYKEEMLNEFFNVANQNNDFIENKIFTLEKELEQKLMSFLSESAMKTLDILKQENLGSLQNIIHEFYNEISSANKMDFENLKKTFEVELGKIQDQYRDKYSNDLGILSEENKKVLSELSNSKKSTFEVLSESIEKSKVELLESFKKSFDKHKSDFENRYKNEFQNLLKSKEGEIKNTAKNIFENHKSFFDTKKREIEDSSKEILEESKKKIKDLEKKVNDLSAQLNKSNSDKKKVESVVQDAKKYTDIKMNQILEESKKYTRIMMDFVGGGGGGSVAVQYAGGGTINGDLNVAGNLSAGSTSITLSSAQISGDLDISGTLTANTILSGDRDLTDIFAGEGVGDDNPLDGGLI